MLAWAALCLADTHEAWRAAAPYFDALPDGAAYDEDVTNLRAQLLKNYDKTVPPHSHRVGQRSVNSTVGTDVSLAVRFFKLESITTAEGSMRIHVWVYHAWQDDRLKWNPMDHGRISKVYFSNPYLEEPEIWLPDITTFNARLNPDEMYEKSYQSVNHMGGVSWIRPGVLDILCTFSGFVAFPYDHLRCVFEMGGWQLGGFYEGILLQNKTEWVDGERVGGVGYQFSAPGSTSSAGEVYQEYKVSGPDLALTSAETCPEARHGKECARGRGW